jgi:hypothetical protein
MPPPRQEPQERRRLGRIGGLSQNAPASRHGGVGAQHQFARPGRQRGGLFRGDADGIGARRLARLRGFVDIGMAHRIGPDAELGRAIRAGAGWPNRGSAASARRPRYLKR